jgi:DNA anti-recombination protein RmuC
VADASLGLIMLGLLAVTLFVFLVSSALQESRNITEWKRHNRALEAQRDLADRAEASRFTDLRQHIDTHLRESRQREAAVATDFEKSVVQSQRELRSQLEQMNRTLLVQLGELEARLDARLGRQPVIADSSAPPADINPTDPSRRRVNV